MSASGRYEATWSPHPRVEIEKRFDQLEDAKSWIAGFLSQNPAPIFAQIVDYVNNEIVFEELNPE